MSLNLNQRAWCHILGVPGTRTWYRGGLPRAFVHSERMKKIGYWGTGGQKACKIIFKLCERVSESVIQVRDTLRLRSKVFSITVNVIIDSRTFEILYL